MKMKSIKLKLLALVVTLLNGLNAWAFDFDLNGDGGLDSLDYKLLSAIIIDKASTYDAKYDADGNGTIDAVDANLLIREMSRVRVFNVNGVTFRMVLVEGGTFKMGGTAEQGSDASANTKPAHDVTLRTFMIAETEVTQALWKAVMGENNNPSNFSNDDSKPVERVTWNQCKNFIQLLNDTTKMNFRLPTEAEWEYAARGGKYSEKHRYSGSDTASEVAWFGSESGYMTHAVGTKVANELGLFDMSGNVWEWCNDWYGIYSSSAQNNPTGPSSGSSKIIRGGAWSSGENHCRVSYRSLYDPNSRDSDIGFRLALDE